MVQCGRFFTMWSARSGGGATQRSGVMGLAFALFRLHRGGSQLRREYSSLLPIRGLILIRLAREGPAIRGIHISSLLIVI